MKPVREHQATKTHKDLKSRINLFLTSVGLLIAGQKSLPRYGRFVSGEISLGCHFVGYWMVPKVSRRVATANSQHCSMLSLFFFILLNFSDILLFFCLCHVRLLPLYFCILLSIIIYTCQIFIIFFLVPPYYFLLSFISFLLQYFPKFLSSNSLFMFSFVCSEVKCVKRSELR